MTYIHTDGQEFGTGGIKQNKYKIKLKWKLRLQQKKVCFAPIPFDWSVGAGIQKKIATPLQIDNQGKSLSCGGQAKSKLIELKRAIRSVEGNLSAKSFYSRLYYKGGGMLVEDLERDIGINLESDVPSMDAYGQPLSEQMYEDKSWITADLLKDALKRKGYLPISINLDIDSTAQAIRDYDAVIILIEGQSNGTWLSVRPTPPSNTNPIWRHFMCSYDVPVCDVKDKVIKFYQSWGTLVGEGGIQEISEAYFKSGHIIDVIAFDFKDSPAVIAARQSLAYIVLNSLNVPLNIMTFIINSMSKYIKSLTG